MAAHSAHPATVLRSPGRLFHLGRQDQGLSGRQEAFDRAMRLAKRVLGADVALLSTVTKSRQEFKAHEGAPDAVAAAGGTPIEYSFCRHVVAANAPFVVTDARHDPRVAGNPAIDEMGVIGYLGVPVRGPTGAALGALCVITYAPRDWTDADCETLQDIVSGVESEISASAATSEAVKERERLGAVLDELPVGVVVARSDTLEIVLRNRTAERILVDEISANQPGDLARLGGEHPDGRRYRPEDYPLMRAAREGVAIETEPMIYRRGDGELIDLEVSARCVPSAPGLVIATFSDVTQRNADRAEIRRHDDRLARFHDLTGEGIVEIDADDRILFANARFLRLARAEHGGAHPVIGPESTIWDVLPAKSGSDFAMALERARETGTPETCDRVAPNGSVSQIRICRDGVRTILFLQDVTEARRLEESRLILTRELNHRVKNLFAIVSGMVGMTAKSAADPAEMARSLRQRIRALAQAHDLIRPAVTMEDMDRSDVTLSALASALISPHCAFASETVSFEGPALSLTAAGSTNLALVLHELATNAAKYGALSARDGRLEVSWRVEGGDLVIDWLETGGPPVTGEPGRTGFGSRLIDMIVGGQLQGSFRSDWSESGLEAVITVPRALVESKLPESRATE